ncbi:F-box/kelch-repeat protein At2g43445-like [Triticum aestivum]|uniref:F-box/kelch-repeat protein At2g43445-like n=1 Tax=Triticum aestivum TaxID=4565 RepID=UPI001D003A30|nr:F-box/kelch-repeat protein At2g43445-like [Triticum aestivum]
MGKEESRATRPTPYLPHEVITEILLRLPVTSILRFRCVSKAWRRTLSKDPSFRLHRQRHPCLLIAPEIQLDRKRTGATAGLYRWEEAHGAATLMHPIDPLSKARGLAHCDGLVLVATDLVVCVLNPATHRVLTLLGCHHPFRRAFGLGRDPRTGTYKVARYFYQTDFGLKVFTIGVDQHWRQLMAESPHLVNMRRTATFFKGSLLWTFSRYDYQVRTGFLRLRLEDETFNIVPPPPCFGEHTMPLHFTNGKSFYGQ